MQPKNLTDYIRVYDDVVLPEHCDEIIEIFNKSRENWEIHNTPLYQFNQLNLNADPQHAGLVQAIAGTMVNAYHRYFADTELTPYVKFEALEDIRIKKYIKGTNDRFDTHVDVADASTSGRFCIAIIYLNDNDGATYFPGLDVEVKPKTGRVVIFPPFWMFPHGGRTPTDANKYIMMTSLHYR